MRLTLPTRRRHRPTTDVRPVIRVAHRGASAELAENTLAAIRRAVELGSDLVEIDVQRSKDGALVVVHDKTLVRTTNVQQVFPHRDPWRVGDFTYDELIRLDAGSWKSPRFAGERIPTLAEVLEAVSRSGVGLLVELKHPGLYPGIVTETLGTLRQAPGYVDAAAAGRLVVQSFDFAAMKELKAQDPAVPVGLLGTPTEANLPALSTWADQINPPPPPRPPGLRRPDPPSWDGLPRVDRESPARAPSCPRLRCGRHHHEPA